MLISLNDTIALADYLIKTNKLKKLSAVQIATAYQRAKATITSSSPRTSEDAQYDYEMDTIEEELKKM